MCILEKENVRDVINQILNDESKTYKELMQYIFDFVNMFESKKMFLQAFENSKEFQNACKKASLLNSEQELENNTELLCENYVSALKKIFDTDIVSKEKKKVIANDFATLFMEYSDNEDCCSQKIYVVIRNINYEEGQNIIKEYDSIETAEKCIEEEYICCCDDSIFAEEVWFPLLCAIQNNEWDYMLNYCTVFEIYDNSNDMRKLVEE